MTNIGQRVKRFRTAKDLTVRDLARVAGVSVSYVYAVEAGTRGQHMGKLERIAQALGVPLSALYGDDES